MISMAIETSNAAFEGENKFAEVARIFDEVAEKMADEQFDIGMLRDINGNPVGHCAESDKDFSPKKGSWFVARMETGNAAFDDVDKGNECARIMRAAAEKIRGGETSFNLRDSNGNPVGQVEEKIVRERGERGERSAIPTIANEEKYGQAKRFDLKGILKTLNDEGVGAHVFTAADMRPDIRGKLLAENAVSLEDAELERVFDGAVLPEFCIKEAKKARLAGLTMDDIREFAGLSHEGGKQQEMESLYVAMAKAGIAMDHHETDLYVDVTPESTAVLAKYPLQKGNATTFTSNIDGVRMYDIPFAYEPAWAKKLGAADLGELATDSGRHLGKVVDIANGFAIQNSGRGQLQIHDLKQLNQSVKVGAVIDVNYVGKMGQVTVVEQGKGVER